MAEIRINPQTLTVHFSRTEKFSGLLLRDITVPLSQVSAVTAEPDGISALRGIRSPGLGLPFVRHIGTWRRPGHRTAVSVSRNQPAVHITLAGHHYSDLLIGVADADELAARLRDALPTA